MYKIGVEAQLNTSEMEKTLQEWEKKSKTVKIDLDTGDILKTTTKIEEGFGKIGTIIETDSKRIANVTDNTKKWEESQNNLRAKMVLSTQQLERMSVNADNLRDTWGKNSSGINDVQSRIKNLSTEYMNMLNNSQKLDRAEVQRLNNQQKEIQESINLMKAQNDEMGTSFGAIAKFATQFFSIQKAFQLTTELIRNMVSEVFKLDESLTELGKVADLTSTQLESVTNRAFDIGESIGRTGRDVLDSVTNFKRAGYEMNEAFDLGETTLIMTNVADGITDVNEASVDMISILKGFGLQASDSMHVIDGLNNTSNNMAVTYKNLVDVLQRSSATLNQAGVSMEQSIGLATGALEILGDKPEQVGRALNSLTQRLRGLKQVGEDGYLGVSKLNTELEKITSKHGKKVSVFDDMGNLKDTYQILKELSEIYPKLTKNEQSYIAELSAGEPQTCQYVQKCA